MVCSFAVITQAKNNQQDSSVEKISNIKNIEDEITEKIRKRKFNKKDDAENELKKIFDNFDKKQLNDYISYRIKKMDEVRQKIYDRIDNDTNPQIGEEKVYTENMYDGTPVTIKVSADLYANDSDINISAKSSIEINSLALGVTKDQTIRKQYGKRLYTFVNSFWVIPKVTELTTRVHNGYYVGSYGLKSRYIETSYYGGLGHTVDELSSKWADNSATAVGHNIDSYTKWKIVFGIAGNGFSWTEVNRCYVKIVKWDKKKQWMDLEQKGRVSQS